MRFSITLVAAFAAYTIAAPVASVKRAAVLSNKTYDEISISGGTAGNAEAEALAVFSALNLNDKANGRNPQTSRYMIPNTNWDPTVDAADIKFLSRVNNIANEAEVGAFNPAIEAASGAAKDALAAGKTKNKVLKLVATKLQLEIQAAQGKDTSAKLAAETKKLNNNIAADKARAGAASTKLAFAASTA